jgi:bifunctional DNase/RNase
MAYHEMRVFGFTLDPLAQRPVVILKDAGENNSIPIWIGSMEAVSIVAELISSDISTKSGGGSLLSKVLEKIGMRMTRISLDSLNDGVFSATVALEGKNGVISLDVRPYEALAASLKYDLPVMVADEVIAQGSMIAMNDDSIARETDARRFIDFLEKLDPADLGKYPM